MDTICNGPLSEYNICFEDVFPFGIAGGTGKPNAEEIKLTQDRTRAFIRVAAPKVVVFLGSVACSGVGLLIKNELFSSGDLHRLTFDDGFSCWGLVGVHPAYVLRNPEDSDVFARAVDKIGALCQDGPAHEVVEFKTTEKLLKAIENNRAAFDLETRGLKPHKGGILTCAASWRDSKGILQSAFVKKPNESMLLKMIETRKKHDLIIHNSKYELSWLQPKMIRGFEDTLLRHWYINENESLGLDHLAMRYVGAYPYWHDNPDPSTYADWDQNLLGQYNGLDTAYSYELWEWQEEREHLLTPRNKQLLRSTIQPLACLLARMERDGVYVDTKGLKAYRNRCEIQIAELQLKMDKAFPNINWRSPKQVRELLFDKLKLPILEYTGTGLASTSEEVITKLALKHKVLEPVHKLRSVKSKLGRIIDPLLENCDDDGLIHASINIGLVVTRRLSCSKPNLQNIEREGEEKKFIVSRFKGGKLIKADYGQFELRLSAIGARAAKFKEIIESGRDPHDETRALIAKIPGITIEVDRQLGKRINLAMASGISPGGLEYNWGIPKVDGKKFHAAWFKEHPEIRRYHLRLIEDAKRTGYVENYYGSRRHIPAIKSRDWERARSAENQLKNFPIQGGGAETIYGAMVKIQQEIEKRKLQSLIVLQVHDEIVIDSPPKEVKLMEGIVRESMLQPFDEPYFLPMDVDIVVGDSLAKK